MNMKIIAVLLNPTVDQLYEIEDFQVGGTFKVGKSIIYPVGKAISFALGVRELNQTIDVKIIACIGKDEIPIYSEFLTSRNIQYEFIAVNGKTRSNKTINDPIKRTTTHIREKGFKLDEDDLKSITNCLEKTINVGDYVIFSGSIPPNVDDNIYYKMINISKEKGAMTALDTNGKALIKGISANPTIIKPNLVELSQILNKPELNELNFSNILNTVNSIIQEAKTLLNQELKVVLITLGNNGAILINKDLMIYGNVHVDKIDTVGSGDSFLAGFILGNFLKKDFFDLFKLAIACGAANTLIQGPGIFKKEDVEKLIKKVEIIDLS
jgi:1-phosphofructokinase family hexose kinase